MRVISCVLAVRRNLNPNPNAKNQQPCAIELYDLATDPGETTDVARKQPNVVARLRAVLDEQHVKSELFPIRALDKE